MIKKFINTKAILAPLLMLTAMWIGFLFQNLGLIENCDGSLIPLVPEGLKGVIFSPLLHGNLEHIAGNSIPITVLLFLLYQFYPKLANSVLFWGWIASGLIVWLLPPMNFLGQEPVYTCIIGASGIVYMLAFFLFFSGIVRKNKVLLTVALLVALYYGSLIWGIFPEELFYKLDQPSKISWQAHLSGAVVGLSLAFIFKNKHREKNKKFIWEFPNYYSEKDDKLWQDYTQNNPEHFLEEPKLKKDDIWEHLDEIRKK
jgi:membrane associated rhomboid family serine protease